MTPESPGTTAPPPAETMSEAARISGVFFEPKKAFTDIGKRPHWLVPLLLTIAATLAYMITFGQHVGWDRFMRHEVETNARTRERMEQVPAEKRESSMELGAKIAGYSSYGGAILGIPIIYLISAVLFLVGASIAGAGLKFNQIFAVVCYAGLPVIIKNLLAIVVMFLKNPDDFNLRNPLAFNPAAFMDPNTSSKFLYSVATYVDVFTIWTMLLTAAGLSAAAGKRLSFGGALLIVLIPWAILILFGASMASMFS
jgi:Yip1 domain